MGVTRDSIPAGTAFEPARTPLRIHAAGCAFESAQPAVRKDAPIPAIRATILCDHDVNSDDPPYVLRIEYTDPPGVAFVGYPSRDAAEAARARIAVTSIPDKPNYERTQP